MSGELSYSLPYPERFDAAVNYASNPKQGTLNLSDEVRLVLFALHKQATEGPCRDPKPWGWNMVESAKWQSWSQLGNMPKEEAMRLYVRTLEEVQPDWWSLGEASSATNTGPAKEQPPQQKAHFSANGVGYEQRLSEAAAEGSWSTPYLDGSSKPTARYEHGVAIIGSQMFVIGGNSGGRYLNDIWVFDFATLEWTNASSKSVTGPSPPPSSEPSAPPPPPPPPLPPVAGHQIVVWKNSLLVIGGHVKSKDATPDLKVRVLDPKGMDWTVLEPSGEAPASRGGHSATLIGSRLYIFGGEDTARRPLGDLSVLDLDSMTWSTPEFAGRAPAARSAHVSTAYDDRFMVIFGGGSVAHCFNDLYVLDTNTMAWYTPIVNGRLPTPRAGHSASALGDHWYIVGGGNNASGCTDMAFMDLSPLLDWVNSDDDEVEMQLQWTIVGTVPERSYIASEGMSLVTVEAANVLVSFGGYNGKYSNAVSLFRPKSSHISVSRVDQKNQQSPRIPGEKENGVLMPGTGRFGNNANVKSRDADPSVQAKLDAAWQEAENAAREAAAAKESAAHELALMRRQLMSAQTSLDEKEKAYEDCRAQLDSEQARSLQLEGEIAELRDQLQYMAELEKELEMYRRQVQETEKKGGGIWGWVGGN